VKNRLRLIVGLGNPGVTYKNTRHNVGFMVADKVADVFSILIQRKKFDALYGRGFIHGIEVILAKPMAFMNRSGPPVQEFLNYFKIPSKDMLVIHDDIDLPLGRLKIIESGGHGGHKGVKSLIDTLGTDDFPRIRIGIGRSEQGISVVDHVLGEFTVDEETILEPIVTMAENAVVTILCKGIKEGMNDFNRKRTMITG
jgi:PTH1 family peptidyl-tRNA hydrolase